MLRRFAVLAMIVLFAVALPIAAPAVPGAFSYQGKLSNADGKDVPNGTYTLVFRLYAVASGPNAALWTSSPTSVETIGGVFTTTLSPPASLFGSTDLWLETTVGESTLTPRVRILSSPFAFRAAAADSAAVATTVPDGSITLAKLGSDVDFMRAPYLTGVTSGLPTEYTLKFFLNGVAIEPQPKLAAPYTEGVEVVWYKDGTPSILRSQPGKRVFGRLVLRRALTGDRALRDWAVTVKNGNYSRRDLKMTLMGGSTELASWTFAGGWPSQYNVKLADDGLPVEEVSLVFDEPVHRRVDMAKTGKPLGSGTQLGYTSGLALYSYRVSSPNLSYNDDLAIASDHGFKVDVLEVKDLSVPYDGYVRPGDVHMNGITLRQNPSSRCNIHDWYWRVYDIVQRGSLTVSLSSKTAGTTTLATYQQVWPCSYTLSLGDDGQLIESFGLVYDDVSYP